MRERGIDSCTIEKGRGSHRMPNGKRGPGGSQNETSTCNGLPNKTQKKGKKEETAEKRLFKKKRAEEQGLVPGTEGGKKVRNPRG